MVKLLKKILPAVSLDLRVIEFLNNGMSGLIHYGFHDALTKFRLQHGSEGLRVLIVNSKFGSIDSKLGLVEGKIFVAPNTL